jgi:hypothetical protein
LINVLRRAEAERTELTVANAINPALIGIIGEPFVRFNSLLKNNLPKRLGELGGRLLMAPLSDEARVIIENLFSVDPGLRRDDVFPSYRRSV